MEIVNRQVKLVSTQDYAEVLRIIELCGRNCYHSEGAIKEGSAEKFIKGIIKADHTSVLEHCNLTFEIICDRAVMAQMTRHRLATFHIESQRYNRYSDDVKYIVPYGIDGKGYDIWRANCIMAEEAYRELLENGYKPETARSVLPNCVATVMKMTMNFRELRHFFGLRCDSHAQIDCRLIANEMLKLVYEKYPVFVADLWEKYINKE